MPRREARVQVTIWSNSEFAALSQEDQRTYFLAFSQPGISLCGVLPMTLGRWAGMAADTTTDSLRASIARLEAARFVVADYEKDELLVRSFLRHDGVWRNSKTRAGAMEQLKHIASPKIRASVDAEITRIKRQDDLVQDGQTKNRERSLQAERARQDIRAAAAQAEEDEVVLKPCLVCSDLSHESRCPAHRIKRPSGSARGYDATWQKPAKAQIKAVPWCQCQGCSLHDGPCNAEVDLTADHVRPIARGGTADHGLQTLCRRRNSSKKDRVRSNAR